MSCTCNALLQNGIFITTFMFANKLIMKKFLSLLFLLSGFLLVQGQTNQTQGESLQLKASTHDFGKIPQHKPVYYSFEVFNTGKEPIKLENVQATCGCTTPEWSREPIQPGAAAFVKVGFNAAAEGYFDKNITIIYNNNQQKQLKITGTVWKTPDGIAPANASVQFLKKQTL